MIARSWSGKVPVVHASAFHEHLLDTGVADYRRQAGCLNVQLWRYDEDGWAFLLLSTWRDMDAIRLFAGETLEVAVLYPEDDLFDLVPDPLVRHYTVLSLDHTGSAPLRACNKII